MSGGSSQECQGKWLGLKEGTTTWETGETAKAASVVHEDAGAWNVGAFMLPEIWRVKCSMHMSPSSKPQSVSLNSSR